MKVLSWVGVMLLTAACNNAAPTATSYKQQLGTPAGVAPGTGNATGGAADPAAGQAALNGTCNNCHGKSASVLDASDAAKIKDGSAAKNGFHDAFKAAFDKDQANIAAFLEGGSTGGAATPAAGAGDAAKGEALLTGTCEAQCHGTTAGPLDSFANLTGQDTAAYHPDPIKQQIAANKADLEAALKARPQ